MQGPPLWKLHPITWTALLHFTFEASNGYDKWVIWIYYSTKINKPLRDVIISLTLVFLTSIWPHPYKETLVMNLRLAKFAFWSCTDHPLNFLSLNTGSEEIITSSAYGRQRQVQGATSTFHFLSFRTTKTYKWEKNLNYSIILHQVKTQKSLWHVYLLKQKCFREMC